MHTPRRVAFAGLGIMGAPMAANLVRAGLEVAVYTRTLEKAARFAAEHDGARAAATPADAARDADAFVGILPDAPQVEEVLFGEQGAAAALADDALVVDMSTISPTASKAIAGKVAPRPYVEAPVSGSKPKAQDGTLTIMAGASSEDFEKASPLFEILGERIVHVGPVGHGQMAKLLTNTMAAVNAAALAECIRTAKAAGLEEDAFLEVASGSAGASAMVALKGPPMFEERFEPALFKLEHMLKDVRHCIAEARALGIELQLGTLAETFYALAAADGRGEQDFASVYAAL
jgi:3-hydroxyisobutyrate dehydrogenase-like beta-hydroxyacid dehydrogenase